MGRFGCQEVEKFVHVFVDGEFDEADRREFELHLGGCERCRNMATFQSRFRRAFRAAVPELRAPAALRERLKRELDRAPASAEVVTLWARLSSLPLRPVPIAAAAAVLLALMWSSSGVLPVVAESISKHRRSLPLEVPGPDAQSVRSWFDGKVDFPVRPPRFGNRASRKHASLVGARLSNIQSRQAAYLLYNVGGARVSVIIFDADGMPLEASRHRRVGQREVYFDNQNGYQVAVFRDRGVGYAITGDVDENEMVHLVETAFSP